MAYKWITSGLIVIATVGTGAYLFADHQSTQKVKHSLDQLADELSDSGQGELHYDDPHVGLFSKQVSVNKIQFDASNPSSPDIHIEKMVISNIVYDQQTNLPVKMHIELLNATAILNQVDQYFADSDALTTALFSEIVEVKDNTASIHYDAEAGYELDPAQSNLNIYSSTNAEEMMSSRFEMSLVNVPDINAGYMQSTLAGGEQAAIAQQQTQEFMEALSKTALTQLKLSVQDHGIVAKIYQAALQDPDIISAMQKEGLKPSVHNLKLLLQHGLEQSLVNQERPVSELQEQLVSHAKTFLASDDPYLEVTINSVKPEGLGFTDALVLMMSNGHPDIVKSLMQVEIITH
jgi:hypothetical protein